MNWEMLNLFKAHLMNFNDLFCHSTEDIWGLNILVNKWQTFHLLIPHSPTSLAFIYLFICSFMYLFIVKFILSLRGYIKQLTTECKKTERDEKNVNKTNKTVEH